MSTNIIYCCSHDGLPRGTFRYSKCDCDESVRHSRFFFFLRPFILDLPRFLFVEMYIEKLEVGLAQANRIISRWTPAINLDLNAVMVGYEVILS